MALVAFGLVGMCVVRYRKRGLASFPELPDN
ncbi:hypothetical protein [Nitrosospira sp. Nsp14]